MNSETLAVQRHPPRHQISQKGVDGKFTESEPSVLLMASLWLFQSIFSACKIEFIGNLQGAAISFNVQDVLLLMSAAWMMHKGLCMRKTTLIFPWVVVTLYGLYFNHYKSLRKMVAVLRTVRYSTGLHWVALVLMSVSLGLRVIFILRTLLLSANLWYRRKMEKKLCKALT
ncbi:uncharacterized protein [Euwallacea fornicatus]|uniref:uncharacterized protein n=1 Tax=Euwallacea fornicatus TaxID=995702 RepID=UPI0033903A0A